MTLFKANDVTVCDLMLGMPIHYVRAWSGAEADESPVCGADKNDRFVWGNRTAFTRHVSCGECRRKLGLLGRFPEGE